MFVCILCRLARLNLGGFGRPTTGVKHYNSTDSATTLLVCALLTSLPIVLLHSLLLDQSSTRKETSKDTTSDEIKEIGLLCNLYTCSHKG
jgi:hypothetical protein